MNKLKKLFDSLSPEERRWQLGAADVDPLRAAFVKKRITHAGIGGIPIAAADKQKIWQELNAQPPTATARRSAYIHIPFCQTKCLYCGFFQNHCSEQAETAYIDLLVRELEMSAGSKLTTAGPIHTVFIGGGTPSCLSAENVSRLLQAIRTCLPLSNDYELTLEGRIRDLVPEKLETWFAGGVNRLSIGVQSFDTKLRTQLGRLDNQQTVIENLKRAAAYEQCSLVIDLIYGLPDQSLELWEQDLRLLDELPIDGMDLYQLNVYEHSALNQAIQAGKISPAATTAQQAEYFAFAHKWVEQRFYKRLSNCHWAKNNRERSLYNSFNKTGVDLLAFGSGAGGKIGSYSFMLHRNLQAYTQSILRGEKPFMVLGHRPEDYQLYELITGQLEQGYLDLQKLIATYGSELEDLTWLMDVWAQRGLCNNNGQVYALTIAGQFWLVNLTQSLLEATKFLISGEYGLNISPVAAQG